MSFAAEAVEKNKVCGQTGKYRVGFEGLDSDFLVYLYVPSLSLSQSAIIFSASISNFSSSISLYTEPNHATAEPLKVKSIQLQIFLLLRKELLARLARFSVDH